MTTRKHALPDFLDGQVSPEAYERWLDRKAKAHLKRDRLRGHTNATGAAYREAIHAAVARSKGVDAYTGEHLDWHLISQYDNEQSKEGKHHYKAAFALLPTVDHIEAAASSAEFQVCGWRTNDAKHDLTVSGFLDLCTKVLVHAGYTIVRPDTQS